MNNIQSIKSEDINLGNLFNDFYVVPNFQREYVWEDLEVNQLLQDVYSEFMGGDNDPSSEYFIGSIVVCSDDEGVFEIIDGQQRVTTLYLCLCAVRDHLKKIAADPIQILEQQIASASIDSTGKNIFRYRVLLQYEDSCGLLEHIAQGQDESNYTMPETTRSVTNILNAYQLISTFIRNEFGEDQESIRKFFAFFNRNVKLIRVKTISIARALKVFETINDRGVGLDSMDLLKNLMFMQSSRQDFDRLNDRWKDLIDTLYQAPEKPLRFLRYFIFSQFKVDRLKEDQIYDWFTRNAALCGYNTDPFAFLELLIRSAKAYSLFINGKNVNGTINRYLVNIRFLSGAARQHLILLLSGRHLPVDCFTELTRHIENLFFTYIITREPTREFERTFALWAPELRQVHDQQELNVFIARRFIPAKEDFAARFTLAFNELSEWSLQKYRIRYVLAKFTQYINELAWGSSGVQADLRTFISNEIDIEHILPQTPSQEVLQAFDKKDEINDFINALGNLTLVEKTINCSIGNGLFEHKKSAYSQSNFLITKTLAEEINVGVNTAVNRVVQKLLTFNTWNSNDIDQRQEMLTQLAKEVWDMPA